MTKCDVAIIGAGPYGLSIAAHLKARGVDFRIFGKPMHTWLEHMPKGMHLKSEGFASSLYDPGSTFTLEVYCKQKGIEITPAEIEAEFVETVKGIPDVTPKTFEQKVLKPQDGQVLVAYGEVIALRGFFT